MTPADVTIVDYGVGNLGSLRNALAKVGRTASVSDDPDVIATSARIILPGVGAFDRAVDCRTPGSARPSCAPRRQALRWPACASECSC